MDKTTKEDWVKVKCTPVKVHLSDYPISRYLKYYEDCYPGWDHWNQLFHALCMWREDHQPKRKDTTMIF